MEHRFMRVNDVAKELDVSESFAYKIIQKLNRELKEQGFITISGRINREYFNKRIYGNKKEESTDVGT